MAYRRNHAVDLRVTVNDSNARTPPRSEVGDVGGNSEAKNVWIVRHGESEHNSNCDWGLRDPSLTQRGRKQAKALIYHPMLREALGFVNKEQMARLVVVSPLRRTLETGQMVAEAMKGQGIAHPWVPIVANPDLQELGDGPNDTGHPAKVMATAFPEVNFDHVPEDWFDKRKEGNNMRHERSMRFCQWLLARPEPGIICIGHLDFFRDLTGVALKNCGAAHFVFANGTWQCQHALPKQKSPPPDGPLPSPPLPFTPMTVSAEARRSLMTPTSMRKCALKGRADMYVGDDEHDADSRDPRAEATAVALFELLLTRCERPASEEPAQPTEAAGKAAGRAVLALLEERDTLRPAGEGRASLRQGVEVEDCLERGRLARWLVELGAPARQAGQLVTHLACTGRASKPLTGLSLVTRGEWIRALALSKFRSLRHTLGCHLPAPLALQPAVSPSLPRASTHPASLQRLSPPAPKDSLRPGPAVANGHVAIGDYFRSPLSTPSTPSLTAPQAPGNSSTPSAGTTRRSILQARPPYSSRPDAQASTDLEDDATPAQRAPEQQGRPPPPWARTATAKAHSWTPSFHAAHGASTHPTLQTNEGRPSHVPASTTGSGQFAGNANGNGWHSGPSGVRHSPAAARANGSTESGSSDCEMGVAAQKRKQPERNAEREVWAAEQRVAQLSVALQEAQQHLAGLHASPTPSPAQRSRGSSRAF